jgi:hypothetical protein
MKIGIDFDKVFVSPPPFIPPSVIDMFYKKKNGTLSYRIPGAFEKKIRILSHSPILRKPINQNLSYLQKISKKNPEIYLVSSRFSFLKNKTDNWVKKYDIEKYFKKMYFNYEDKQPHIFKNEILQSLHIDTFIDDDLDLLLYLSKHNPKIKFYFLTNKKILPNILSSNITQIHNLQEFYSNYL